ncbi:MAG: VOC family protein [Roseiflexaceae bacterium]|jgi:predicted enzyme related to lactoylglutathione lyase
MAHFLKALVTIYAHDIQRSAYFYGEVLGLAESYRFPATGDAEHIEYTVGATTVAISSPAGLIAHGMPPASAGHPCEIGLKTDDIVAVFTQLRAAGVQIIKEPTSSAAGNWYGYCADPDGNWISIYQNMA